MSVQQNGVVMLDGVPITADGTYNEGSGGGVMISGVSVGSSGPRQTLHIEFPGSGEKVAIERYGSGWWQDHISVRVTMPVPSNAGDSVEGLCGSYTSGISGGSNTYVPRGETAAVDGWGGWGDLSRFSSEFGNTWQVTLENNDSMFALDGISCEETLLSSKLQLLLPPWYCGTAALS